MTRSGTPRRLVAVGFDFDHTLGIDNNLERVAFLRLLADVCAGGGEPLGTLASEIDRIDTLLRVQRSGRYSIEETVERFARERGARDPGAYPERYKRLALRGAEAFVVPVPGLGSALAALRCDEVAVAVLTNGWSPLQERKAALAGFEGPVVVSGAIGVQKPAKGAFEALARTLERAPDEIWYVGDDPVMDVAGAIAAGMHGIWLDARGSEYPADLPAPERVIHSLEELAGALPIARQE